MWWAVRGERGAYGAEGRNLESGKKVYVVSQCEWCSKVRVVSRDHDGGSRCMWCPGWGKG